MQKLPALILSYVLAAMLSMNSAANAQPVDPQKPRVIISTDIGGTDFDDYQSLIHFLMISNRFDVEGLISSPWGPQRNRVAEIHKIIDVYETDFPALTAIDNKFPTADHLRSVTAQGGEDSAPGRGYGKSTDGSNLIIKAALKDDRRPVWVLVWGGIDDVAQAIHDNPSIKQNIRVYWIGGPNKKWSTAAYTYLMSQHPDLFIIENNSSYRGLFLAEGKEDNFDGKKFIIDNIANRGNLGKLFIQYGGGEFKMGDTPSVLYMLGDTPENPAANSPGGGSFTKAWRRDYVVLDRKAEINDFVETYGMLELNVAADSSAPEGTKAEMLVPKTPGSDKFDRFPGFESATGQWTFRFSPKASHTWKYKIESNWDKLNDPEGGAFTSVNALPDYSNFPSREYPNWWTDKPDLDLAIFSEDFGPQNGARTVSKFRKQFLDDFASSAKKLPVK